MNTNWIATALAHIDDAPGPNRGMVVLQRGGASICAANYAEMAARMVLPEIHWGRPVRMVDRPWARTGQALQVVR